MAEARRLTQVILFFIADITYISVHLQAERCSLFLVDKPHQELVAKVFDGNILPNGTEVGVHGA